MTLRSQIKMGARSLESLPWDPHDIFLNTAVNDSSDIQHTFEECL